jgi:hypothetical protein
MIKTIPVTVAQMPTFIAAAERVYSAEEVDEIVDYVAAHPDAGDVIQGTGGVRKLRWRAKGKGKSGGARIIYYFHNLSMPLYLLAMYTKGEKSDLTPADKRVLRQLAATLVQWWLK